MCIYCGDIHVQTRMYIHSVWVQKHVNIHTYRSCLCIYRHWRMYKCLRRGANLRAIAPHIPAVPMIELFFKIVMANMWMSRCGSLQYTRRLANNLKKKGCQWPWCLHTHINTHTHICTRMCICICMWDGRLGVWRVTWSWHTPRSRDVIYSYGVATMSRRLKIIGLFCKKAL